MGNCCSAKPEEFEVNAHPGPTLNKPQVLDQEMVSDCTSIQPKIIDEATKIFLEKCTELKSQKELINVFCSLNARLFTNGFLLSIMENKHKIQYLES